MSNSPTPYDSATQWAAAVACTVLALFVSVGGHVLAHGVGAPDWFGNLSNVTIVVPLSGCTALCLLSLGAVVVGNKPRWFMAPWLLLGPLATTAAVHYAVIYGLDASAFISQLWTSVADMVSAPFVGVAIWSWCRVAHPPGKGTVWDVSIVWTLWISATWLGMQFFFPGVALFGFFIWIGAAAYLQPNSWVAVTAAMRWIRDPVYAVVAFSCWFLLLMLDQAGMLAGSWLLTGTAYSTFLGRPPLALDVMTAIAIVVRPCFMMVLMVWMWTKPWRPEAIAE
jgi:hypothetical protein